MTKIENAIQNKDKYKRLKTMSDDRRPKTLDSAGPQISEVCSTGSAYIGGDEDPMIADRWSQVADRRFLRTCICILPAPEITGAVAKAADRPPMDR